MQAIVVTAFGDPEVLQLAEVADPVPGPHDLLVRVAAAGINRADLSARAGFYPPTPQRPGLWYYPLDLPAILGIEVAGTVEAVGSAVRGFSVGDAVCGWSATGGYAEKALVADWLALPVPVGVSLEDSAAIPVAYLTSWIALIELADLRPGERVLIHAAGSGVGSAAVQIARFARARVLGTASSWDKLQWVVERDEGYTYDAFVEGVQSRGGADVVMANVGGEVLSNSLAVMNQGGRLVCTAASGGLTPSMNLGAILGNQLTIHGMSVHAMVTPDRVRRFRREVLTDFSDSCTPIVDRTFPLSEAAAAHRYLASNVNVGKVLLLP